MNVERHITPLATLQRRRLLPAPGELLVRRGDWVEPADVVGRCPVPGRLWVVDVSHALGVRRDRTSRYLLKAVGSAVRANEVLAERRWWWGRLLRRHCRAPVGGRIVAIRSGRVLIEAAMRAFELRAQLRGQVTDILPGRGVVISAVGAWIEGVWGSGGEAHGVLKVLAENPGDPLVAGSFDLMASGPGVPAASPGGQAWGGGGLAREASSPEGVTGHGSLIVTGQILHRGGVEWAVEVQARGIITGSVRAELCPWLQSLPIPVLVTDGFGALPMSRQAFSVLCSCAGREAILSADPPARWGVARPEVLIPLTAREPVATASTLAGPQPLQVGTRVRALSAPYQGAVGTVTSLPALPQVVESGARLSVARVAFEPADGGIAVIPLGNLEIIR